MYFSSGGPLKELVSHIAAGAIHDSAERSDAPKCQKETRVAVQDDLYSWFIDGDGDNPSEQPKKIKWVTGPAGSGKTAVLGSLAERCKVGGVLAATFFFASWSSSIGRRRKTAFVTTIAHQLTLYRADLREEISKAIVANSDIFDKNLRTQMEVLVLGPLQNIPRPVNRPGLQGAIIIDGVDECSAEQHHNSPKNNPRGIAERRNAEDQLEILQVLQMAASHPSFPFRIALASRPERVFREFFDPDATPTIFAPKLDLHECYNADADITLFLEAHFSRIRRRYYLPLSWPSHETIRTLVENASGQFIYAATVIRLLDSGHRESPKAFLEAILQMGPAPMTISNPLEQLDALYMHILNSSPDPPLSVRWIRTISQFGRTGGAIFDTLDPVASNIHLLLQKDPESDEAEHLLGNLHSLIRSPPPSDQATTKYDFYHKTLFDFLESPERSGKLYFEDREVHGFLWDRFNQACARGRGTDCSYPSSFVRFLTDFPGYRPLALGSAYSTVLPTPASADWWVTLAIKHNQRASIVGLFQEVHGAVRIALDSLQSAPGIVASGRAEYGVARSCDV
ncbi:hypothetical protein MD484_g2867, partial [Candolleomyces efflorescens]